MTTAASPRASRGRLLLLACALLAVFVAVNLATITRFPIVWQDEVMFTEPAANLALRGAYVSRVWYFDAEQDLWAGNAPLYTLLLAGWLKVFGLSIFAVRAFGFLQAVAGVALAAWAAHRAKLLPGGAVIAFGAIVLLGYGMGINLRAGRYDGLGLLLCGLVALAATMRDRRRRALALVLAGLPVAAVGTQLVVFLVVACAAAVPAFGWRALRIGVPLGVGVAAGGAVLLALLAHFGMLVHFLEHSGRLRGIGGGRLPKDPSLTLLVLTLPFVAVALGRATLRESAPRWLLLLAVGIAAALVLLGHFPNYYAWMAAAPLVVLALRARASATAWIRWPIDLLLVAAALVGLPLQLAALALGPDRDYARVDRFVAATLRPDDVAVVDASAWYAAWPRAAKVYTTDYDLDGTIMSPADRRRVSVLVVVPGPQPAFARYPGNWRRVACLCDAPASAGPFRRGFGDKLVHSYVLAVYRRAP